MKLPKQWQHWCACAGLRPEWRPNRWYRAHGGLNWFYLKGKGRRWRINDLGMFQCGDTHGQFDRWALCDIEETSIPRSKQAFLQAVTQLLTAQEVAAKARVQNQEGADGLGD